VQLGGGIRPGHHRALLLDGARALKSYSSGGKERQRRLHRVWRPSSHRGGWTQDVTPTAGAKSPAQRDRSTGRVSDFGVESVGYTDIGRDGMRASTWKTADWQSLAIPVIIRWLVQQADIEALCEVEDGVVISARLATTDRNCERARHRAEAGHLVGRSLHTHAVYLLLWSPQVFSRAALNPKPACFKGQLPASRWKPHGRRSGSGTARYAGTFPQRTALTDEASVSQPHR
jgi:hypothetical protein